MATPLIWRLLGPAGWLLALQVGSIYVLPLLLRTKCQCFFPLVEKLHGSISEGSWRSLGFEGTHCTQVPWPRGVLLTRTSQGSTHHDMLGRFRSHSTQLSPLSPFYRAMQMRGMLSAEFTIDVCPYIVHSDLGKIVNGYPEQTKLEMLILHVGFEKP